MIHRCPPGHLVQSPLDPRYWFCSNCGATVVDAHAEHEAERDLDRYLDEPRPGDEYR